MKAPDVLDRVLAGEPVQASPEVRELARLAEVLQGTWQAAPAADVTARGKAAALEAFGDAAAMPAVPIVPAHPTRARRLVSRLALAAALIVALPTVAFAVSEDALPGELMYPVKRAFEEVRLALAGSPADEAEVLLGIAAERLGEAAVADALGLDDVAAEALAGYEEAVGRFDERILAAQTQGLPVQGLADRANGLFARHEALIEAITGRPVGPPAHAQAGSDKEPKGGSKGEGQRGKHGGKGSSESAGGGTAGSGGSQGQHSDAGGNQGNGQGGSDQDPAPPDDEGTDSDEEHGDEGPGKGKGSQGKGLGHVKDKGKGHEQGKGKGHEKFG